MCDFGGSFGNFLEPFGNFLEPFGNFLEPFGNFLEPFGNFLEPFDNFLEPSRFFIGSFSVKRVRMVYILLKKRKNVDKLPKDPRKMRNEFSLV